MDAIEDWFKIDHSKFGWLKPGGKVLGGNF